VSELLQCTAGRFSFTDFGTRVLDRYSRSDRDGRQFNFFDVRVGSYGPVWAGLGKMMQGAAYGGAHHRAGEFAAQGVYKVAAQLLPHVEQIAADLEISRMVEFGVPTGLLAALCQKHPTLAAFGVDRSREALEAAQARAEELGVSGIHFIHGDFFAPETWLPKLSGEGHLAIASIHFHEFVADGGTKLKATLQRLREEVPGAYVIAIEQERLTEERRDDVSETVWRYAHSNVLIHHLIQNGQIFTREEWIAVFTDAGCRVATVRPLNYLGYHLYAFQL
jgi:SAM-dependent methyltransferase